MLFRAIDTIPVPFTVAEQPHAPEQPWFPAFLMKKQQAAFRYMRLQRSEFYPPGKRIVE
jgi:hypothetical protein